jgi:hypothetical protein
MRQEERLVSRACPSKKNVSFRCSNLDPHTGQKLVTARPSKVVRNVLMDCETELRFASGVSGGGLIDFLRLICCT